MAKKKDIIEIIEETGKEDERGAAKVVAEVERENEIEAKKIEADHKSDLQAVRKNRHQYIQRLKRMMFVNLYRVDWPDGYRFQVDADDRGLAVEFWDRGGSRYAQGIEVMQDEDYDYAAIDIMVYRVENTVDKLEGRGVYGPEAGSYGTDIYIPEKHQRKGAAAI